LQPFRKIGCMGCRNASLLQGRNEFDPVSAARYQPSLAIASSQQSAPSTPALDPIGDGVIVRDDDGVDSELRAGLVEGVDQRLSDRLLKGIRSRHLALTNTLSIATLFKDYNPCK